MATGAVRTGERLHSAGITYSNSSVAIPKESEVCNSGVAEDMEHILWRCRHAKMESVRSRFWEIRGTIANDTADLEDRRISSDPESWPGTLRTHGIMVKTT